jgi:hypothetical protein
MKGNFWSRNIFFGELAFRSELTTSNYCLLKKQCREAIPNKQVGKVDFSSKYRPNIDQFSEKVYNIDLLTSPA